MQKSDVAVSSFLLVPGEQHSLAVTAVRPSSGAGLLLTPKAGDSESLAAQLFRFQPAQEGTFYLVHVQSGLVVDVARNQWDGNPNLILWTANSPPSKNQRWQLAEDGSLRSVLMPSHCLAVSSIELKANVVLTAAGLPVLPTQRFRAVLPAQADRPQEPTAVATEALVAPPDNADEAAGPEKPAKSKFGRPGQLKQAHVERWDPSTVVEFLEWIGIKKQYADLFGEERISGFQLLRLPDAILQDDLKLRRLDLERLKMHLPKVEPPSSVAAASTTSARGTYQLPTDCDLVFRSMASNKSLRILQSGKVCGRGGTGAWARFRAKPVGSGTFKLQNKGCPTRFLAIRDNELTYGEETDPSTELQITAVSVADDHPVVVMRAVHGQGGVGILPTGDPKPPQSTGQHTHGQFAVHTLRV